MGSFSIALTGLRAQSQSLNIIGNNLANMSTTAYKDETATFADLFYQTTGTNGSDDTLQQGLGVRVQSTESDTAEGGLTTTSNTTDMAIDGSGYFVTKDSAGDQLLTRAGDFQVDSTGKLITADGASVEGLASSASSSSTNGMQDIVLPLGETQVAQASSTFSLSGNLNSSAAVGDTATSQITLYDSLGTAHSATMTYTKTASNTWSYSLALPSGDSTSSSSNASGTLSFDSSGNLTSPAGSVQNITFSGLSDGASDMSLTWTTQDSSGDGLLSQTAAATSTSATQNGYASGSYSGFTVDSDGNVTAKYSNGQTSVVGQIAIATVNNDEGLTRVGDNSYETTLASGQANLGTANSGARGSIDDETLESSNVDISTEFSNLIVAQRAFEANSKTVTTFDEVAQETIDMIH